MGVEAFFSPHIWTGEGLIALALPLLDTMFHCNNITWIFQRPGNKVNGNFHGLWEKMQNLSVSLIRSWIRMSLPFPFLFFLPLLLQYLFPLPLQPGYLNWSSRLKPSGGGDTLSPANTLLDTVLFIVCWSSIFHWRGCHSDSTLNSWMKYLYSNFACSVEVYCKKKILFLIFSRWCSWSFRKHLF